MTFQQSIESTVGAQGAFSEVNPIYETAADRDNARAIAVMRMTERKWAKDIAQSERPVIIITEAGANSAAALSYNIANTFPNIPVIFESKAAEQAFKKGKFCEHGRFQQTTVGHFEVVTDYTTAANALCEELKKSDCVMVFGTPKKPLQTELDNHGTYYINRTNAEPTAPRINHTLIKTMARNTSAWREWNAKIQSKPSL